MSRLPIAAVAALFATPAVAQMAETMPADDPVPFTFTFAATDGATPADCKTVFSGLGPKGDASVGMNDLRFYVSDIVFSTDDGISLPATLDKNDFQMTLPEGAVGLVDLTGNSEGSCAPGSIQAVGLVDLTGNSEGSCAPGSIQFGEGTERVNAQITGMNPLPNATHASFRIGVPQEVMQAVIAAHTDTGAPSPMAEMYWNWAMGYRHFVLNHTVDIADGTFGEGYLHIGSMGCGPMQGKALADRPRCNFG